MQARIELQALTDDITSKFIAPHVNVFYCLGGLTITGFIFQMALGFCLTFFYRPIVTEAYPSIVLLLSFLSTGWVIRSVHRWTASLMVICLVTHIGRVYLTGGFKLPRELTWFTGILLSVVIVSFGVSGYSLPWDQVAFWACKIVTGVPDALPFLGKYIIKLLRGGTSVGQETLTRFFSGHTFVLPVSAVAILATHFSLIRKQGISGPL